MAKKKIKMKELNLVDVEDLWGASVILMSVATQVDTSKKSVDQFVKGNPKLKSIMINCKNMIDLYWSKDYKEQHKRFHARKCLELLLPLFQKLREDQINLEKIKKIVREEYGSLLNENDLFALTDRLTKRSIKDIEGPKKAALERVEAAFGLSMSTIRNLKVVSEPIGIRAVDNELVMAFLRKLSLLDSNELKIIEKMLSKKLVFQELPPLRPSKGTK